MSQELNARWLICRICLKSENRKLYNIFQPIVEDEIEDLGPSLLEKIELCGNIKLSLQTNLPNKICNRCVLLLRAAHKFRDLCHQSQSQLNQFVADIGQKEDANEVVEIHLDSGTENKMSDNVEGDGNGQLADGDYVIEESVVGYDDTSYTTEQNVDSKNNDYNVTGEENDMEYQELSDYEKQYIVEETILTYERDIDGDSIIFEDVTDKPERRSFSKRIIEKKLMSKRKRKYGQGDSNNTVYNCMLCENSYTDKTKYNNHMKIHANDKPHECEICKKRFSTTPQLSRHMNSHTGNRPYKCQYCEASFGDPSTKIKHERIHTNERPYKCSICNKSFAYSNVLKVHMMTHTGEKPHTCEYCGKSFSQIHHKNTHEKRHTNVNMVVLQNSTDEDYVDDDLFDRV